jgi:hypothetical protein
MQGGSEWDKVRGQRSDCRGETQGSYLCNLTSDFRNCITPVLTSLAGKMRQWK